MYSTTQPMHLFFPMYSIPYEDHVGSKMLVVRHCVSRRHIDDVELAADNILRKLSNASKTTATAFVCCMYHWHSLRIALGNATSVYWHP